MTHVEVKIEPPARLPLDAEIRKLELRPCDVVLVRLPSVKSADVAAAIAEQVVAAVPGHRVVVIGGDIEIDVDRRRT